MSQLLEHGAPVAASLSWIIRNMQLNPWDGAGILDGRETRYAKAALASHMVQYDAVKPGEASCITTPLRLAEPRDELAFGANP